MAVHKTVSIREDQNQFIYEHHVALSRLVQDVIDKLMTENSTTQKQEGRHAIIDGPPGH